MSDLAWIGAVDLIGRYRAGDVSPVEVTEVLLDRIDRLDHRLNAWCLVDADAALGAARESADRWAAREPAGLLDGVPVAVKDVFLTTGWPTLKGSVLVDPDQEWSGDAPAVTALRHHRAVLLGKVTTPELGWKGVTDAPAYGVTRSPWDTDLTPGGSSGGSSAALAAGMVPLALGTDGGGSIRIPAGFAGVVGHKPTWGRVPHWPVSPYGALAHAGPMARTVADTALLLQVLSEPDVRDAGALIPDSIAYASALSHDVTGLSIAYSPTLGYVDVHPEIRAAVDRAVSVLADLGARVEEVDPGFADPIEAFSVLWNAGAAQATAHHDDDERERMDPGLQEIVADGHRYSAVEYVAAAGERAQLAAHMNQFLTTYDLLVTPTLPIPAFRAGVEVPDGWPHERWPSWTPFSYPFNLTQQPAASVPCGFTEDGLPIGLQLVGRRGHDATVLRAADAYQRAAPLTGRRPPIDQEG